MQDLEIREAVADDAATIASIYDHYVATTCATFETDAASDIDMAGRIDETHAADLPWLVASQGGGLCLCVEMDGIQAAAMDRCRLLAVADGVVAPGSPTLTKPAPRPPVLLSGGNPQVAKGDGDGPVQAYIAAMPGWKSDIGRQLDELIVRTVPHVRKAVKWNSPLYGVEGKGWFLSVRCFDRYIKLAFFNGATLDPEPPIGSKDPNTRYFHIHETDPFDEAKLAHWIAQAARRPGWIQ